MPSDSRKDSANVGDNQGRFEAALVALREQLSKQTNEHELNRFLDAALSEFETLYREDRQRFSADVIGFLKAARASHRALQDFIEAWEDIADVRSKEEAREMRDHLRTILSQLEDCAVRGRVEKEFRELSQKLVTLPSISEAGAETQLNRRIAELNGDPPACRKCGSPMVLHLGRSTPFWGCSTFPKCYSQRWLTKKQRQRLGVD